MGALAGYILKLRVSNTEMTSPADGTEVNDLDNSTYNELVELLEVNSFGDTYKKRKAGIADTNLDISGSYNPTDSGQMLLKAGAELYVAIYQEGYEKNGVQIPMIIESVEKSAEATGKQDISFSCQGNGAPTVITVA